MPVDRDLAAELTQMIPALDRIGAANSSTSQPIQDCNRQQVNQTVRTELVEVNK